MYVVKWGSNCGQTPTSHFIELLCCNICRWFYGHDGIPDTARFKDSGRVKRGRSRAENDDDDDADDDDDDDDVDDDDDDDKYFTRFAL